MSTPALALAAVGVLLLGVVLGWLWRGALCRRRHPSGRFEPAGLGTFFDEDDAEPAPAEFPGSALPLPDGAAPHPSYVVKAKRASRIYHAPGAPTYARTAADVWFRSVEDAEAAGFRAPRRRGSGGSAPA